MTPRWKRRLHTVVRSQGHVWSAGRLSANWSVRQRAFFKYTRRVEGYRKWVRIYISWFDKNLPLAFRHCLSNVFQFLHDYNFDELLGVYQFIYWVWWPWLCFKVTDVSETQNGILKNLVLCNLSMHGGTHHWAVVCWRLRPSRPHRECSTAHRQPLL